MPVIRIDDEVFQELQARATPLLDTPNSVLRREFGLEPEPQKRRASHGSGVGRRRYHETLLQVLADGGGQMRRPDAIAAVGERLRPEFTAVDMSQTDTGRLRWRVRTAWARKYLVQEGLLRADSERGVWELTDEGRRRATELAGH